jgi:hypothetical protein
MDSSDLTGSVQGSTPRTAGIPGPRGAPGHDVRSDPLEDLAAFPFVEALFGRRSRRFALGDEIPDGPLAYRSRQDPQSLTELERMLVLSAMGGTTGWHYSITRNAHYAPHASNYAGAAAGRTFPSAAGFHTAEFFFTDDSRVYFFPTRDAGRPGSDRASGTRPGRRRGDPRRHLRGQGGGVAPAVPGGARAVERPGRRVLAGRRGRLRRSPTPPRGP